MDNIFNFSICRVTSLNPSILEVFHSNKMNLLLSKLITLEEQLEMKEKCLVDELYFCIGNIKLLDWERNILIKLKRDVYNCRFIEINKQDEHFIMNQTIFADLKDFIENINKRDTIYREVYKEYNRCYLNSKQILLKYADEPCLKNGILFSSDDLFKAIKNLKNQSEENIIETNKYDSIFNSLLNYLTRSATKTSPFSSFNILILTELYKLSTTKMMLLDSTSRSSFKINNLLYLRLKEWVFTSKELYGKFQILLNPTLEVIDNHLHYFRHCKNNEDFCKLKVNNAHFFDIFHFVKNDKPTFNEFVLFLNHRIEMGTNAFAFANKLIELGIINVHYPIDINNKDWLINFIHFLKSKKENIKFIQLLNNILEVREELECITCVTKRNELIEKLIIELNQTDCSFKGLNVSNLFYEDFISLNKPKLNLSEFNESFKEIKLLADVLFQFSFKSFNRRLIYSTFKINFGCDKIPLLEYYEKIYLKNQVYEQALVNYNKEYQVLFTGFFKNILCGNQDYLKDYLRPFIKSPQPNKVSFDLFMQINKGSEIIVNNILNESGINITRFYNLFPDLEKLLDNFSTHYKKDSMIAELRDSSIHNSQIKFEIADAIIDVSQNTISNNYIPLNKLYLKSFEDGTINIVNENDQKIIPMDFSMESLSRRSSLFRFINQFSDDNSEGLSTFRELYIDYAKTNNDSTKYFVHLPRIYLVKNVVIERESWLFSQVFLLKNFKEKNIEESAYLWFNYWRTKQNIPFHGFIMYKIINSLIFTKPQYINFQSPVYFKQFYGKIISGTYSEIKFNELLPEFPDKEDDILWQQKNFKEFVLNFKG